MDFHTFCINQNVFPPLETADENGLLAYGTEISPELIINAYYYGIFPWFNEGDPVLWWSPPIRTILTPANFKASKSLKQSARKHCYEFRVNTSFEKLISKCALTKRKDTVGTWINKDMLTVYSQLHKLGFAHSLETWCNGKLVGGFYGIGMGKVFVGESMFHKKSDASKFALWKFSEFCIKNDIHFIDGQVPSSHLKSLGFKDISRPEYIEKLRLATDLDALDHFRIILNKIGNDMF
jgi:leucyl/phenylalanyl-tRNA---protein transferase